MSLLPYDSNYTMSVIDEANDMNFYMWTLLEPARASGEIAVIPDDNMTQSRTKQLRMARNFTVPVDGFILFRPHARTQQVTVWLRDSTSGRFNFAYELTYDQDLSSYVMGRVVSSYLSLICSTVSGTAFNVSGVFNSVFTNRLPPLRTIDFNTLTSFSMDDASTLCSVPVSQGIVALMPPFGDHEYRYFDAAQYQELEVAFRQIYDAGVPNSGWVAVAFTATPTLLFDTNVSTATVFPTNVMDYVDINVSFMFSSTNAGTFANVDLLLDYTTSNPTTGAEVVTTNTMVVASALGIPLANTSQIVTREFKHVRVTGVLTRVRIQASVSAGTGSIYSNIRATYVNLDYVSLSEEGSAGPASILAYSGITNGQQLAIDSVRNLEVVPTVSMARDLKTGYSRYERVGDMKDVEYILAHKEKSNLRHLYTLEAYADLCKRNFFYNFSRRNLVSYQAASLRETFSKAMNFIKDNKVPIAKGIGGAMMGVGTAMGNPGLATLGNAVSNVFNASRSNSPKMNSSEKIEYWSAPVQEKVDEESPTAEPFGRPSAKWTGQALDPIGEGETTLFLIPSLDTDMVDGFVGDEERTFVRVSDHLYQVVGGSITVNGVVTLGHYTGEIDIIPLARAGPGFFEVFQAASMESNMLDLEALDEEEEEVPAEPPAEGEIMRQGAEPGRVLPQAALGPTDPWKSFKMNAFRKGAILSQVTLGVESERAQAGVKKDQLEVWWNKSFFPVINTNGGLNLIVPLLVTTEPIRIKGTGFVDDLQQTSEGFFVSGRFLDINEVQGNLIALNRIYRSAKGVKPFTHVYLGGSLPANARVNGDSYQLALFSCLAMLPFGAMLSGAVDYAQVVNGGVPKFGAIGQGVLKASASFVANLGAAKPTIQSIAAAKAWPMVFYPDPNDMERIRSLCTKYKKSCLDMETLLFSPTEASPDLSFFTTPAGFLAAMERLYGGESGKGSHANNQIRNKPSLTSIEQLKERMRVSEETAMRTRQTFGTDKAKARGTSGGMDIDRVSEIIEDINSWLESNIDKDSNINNIKKGGDIFEDFLAFIYDNYNGVSLEGVGQLMTGNIPAALRGQRALKQGDPNANTKYLGNLAVIAQAIAAKIKPQKTTAQAEPKYASGAERKAAYRTRQMQKATGLAMGRDAVNNLLG